MKILIKEQEKKYRTEIKINNIEINHTYNENFNNYFLNVNSILDKVYEIEDIHTNIIKRTKGKELIDIYVGDNFFNRYICSLIMNEKINVYYNKYDGITKLYVILEEKFIKDVLNKIFSSLELEPIKSVFIDVTT